MPRLFLALLGVMASVSSAQAAIDFMEVDATKKVITIETNAPAD
ncbi:MAG: hypothetical protein RL759_677, partial [Verrucomicrobiota bacterium]